DHPHHDWRHDVVQDQADLEPEPVERLQQPRPYHCGQKEKRRERQRPQARATTRHQRPKCDDRKDRGKHKAEGAIGGGFDLAPVEVLVRAGHCQNLRKSGSESNWLPLRLRAKPVVGAWSRRGSAFPSTWRCGRLLVTNGRTKANGSHHWAAPTWIASPQFRRGGRQRSVSSGRW